MSRTQRPATMQNGHSDDFQTLPSALTPLLPALRPEWRIWEPACGRGNLVRALEERGHAVIGSDQRDGRDFLRWAPEGGFDAIVTNPPYSAKEQFLARAYSLGRPFAFLMPLTSFEGQKRQRMFREHGLEVVFFPTRINYETPSGRGSGSWFMSAWFCWRLGLPPLTFWTPTPTQETLPL